jgi:hypothetical protein
VVGDEEGVVLWDVLRRLGVARRAVETGALSSISQRTRG